MNKIPKISEAEWEVMKIIWRDNPCTANDVIEKLESITEWKPKTIKSLISRLVKKGTLEFEVKGRIYYYHPLISEEECVKKERRSFLSKFYSGAFKNMLLNFIEEEELTEDDINELKRILDERK